MELKLSLLILSHKPKNFDLYRI